MASSGKRKTTMAKLTRESRLRERRLDKAARKDARRQTAQHLNDPPADIATANAPPVDPGEQTDRDDNANNGD